MSSMRQGYIPFLAPFGSFKDHVESRWERSMIDTFMVQMAHDTRFPDLGTMGGYIVASLTLLFVRLNLYV